MGRNHSRVSHRFDCRLKQLRRRRQVDDLFAANAALPLEVLQPFSQSGKILGVLNIRAVIEEPLGKVLPLCVRPRVGGNTLANGLGQFLAERFIAFFATGDADDGGPAAQKALGPQTVEGGDQLACGQVARSAKDRDQGVFGFGRA